VRGHDAVVAHRTIELTQRFHATVRIHFQSSVQTVEVLGDRALAGQKYQTIY
jgi:hypothetical protein